MPPRPQTPPPPRRYRKKKIPKALREALWLKYSDKAFETKCQTTWCPNRITAYDFQAGHNIPESKGGATTLENLVPICSRCNLSMGNQFTFDEWCAIGGHPPVKGLARFFCCWSPASAAAPTPHPSLPLGEIRKNPHSS